MRRIDEADCVARCRRARASRTRAVRSRAGHRRRRRACRARCGWRARRRCAWAQAWSPWRAAREPRGRHGRASRTDVSTACTPAASLRRRARAARCHRHRPGPGPRRWARGCWRSVLRARRRALVVDADALNLIAQETGRSCRQTGCSRRIPARPRGCWASDTAAVQADRLASLRATCTSATAAPSCSKAQARWWRRRGPTARHLSAIAAIRAWPCRHGRCAHRRHRRASRAAWRTAPLAARAAACWSHALAGDSAARGGQRGLLASDVSSRAARLRCNP